MPIETKFKPKRVSFSWNSSYSDAVNGFQQTSLGSTERNWTDFRTGINNPKWRFQIASCQDATTDLSGSKSEIILEEGNYNVIVYWSYGIPGDPWPRTYSFQGIHNALLPDFYSVSYGQQSQAENVALMSAYKKIKQEHKLFSGLTFLGELRQAISMVKKPARALQESLFSYIATLKRRSKGVPMNPAGNRKRKDILAETWLEYSFGWVPLLSDIGSAAKVISEYKTGKDGSDTRRRRISAYGEDVAAVLEQYENMDSSIVPLIREYRTTGKNSSRYRIGLSYKTSLPTGTAKRVFQASGFELAEFIPTAWELLPWSFLIDYFTNIGDLLEAFTTPKDNIYRITKTVRSEALILYRVKLDRQRLSLFPGVYGPYSESGHGTTRWISKKTTFARTKVASLDLPRLQMENPFGKNTLVRSLNMSALALSARSLKPFYR